MKNKYVLFLFLSFILFSCEDKLEFNHVIPEQNQVVLRSLSDDNHTVSFKIQGENVKINWGDGKIENLGTVGTRDVLSHKYKKHGDYTILIETSVIKTLEWSKGDLIQIKFGQCDGFEQFHCSENYLNALDLSGVLPSIKVVSCRNNGISNLKLNKATNLEELTCCENQNMGSLSIDDCPRLETLICYTCDLSKLDLSGNKSLYKLVAYSNKISSINIDGCDFLGEIDLSQNDLSMVELDKLFFSLPEYEKGKITVIGNPGSLTCDKSIAEKKGWKVIVQPENE